MKTEKNRKLKGSVLLTVVSIMALLIVFLTSALVLATASNRRAHRDYSSSQAEYTARAAIDSAIASINQNVNVRAAVQEINAPMYANVSLGNDSLGRLVRTDASGNDVFDQITLEPVLDSNGNIKQVYYYDNNGVTTAWHAYNQIKITATVRVGKERKTVSVYAATTPTGVVPSPTPSNLQGLNTAGSAGFTTTAGVITGALNLGLKETSPLAYEIHNDTLLHEAENFVNGSLDASGGGIYLDVMSASSKTTILGDLTLSNHSAITINYSPANAPAKQQDVPYLFVEGCIRYNGNVDLNLGASNGSPSSKSPYNMFAGYCDIAQAYIAADLYLMDEYVDPTDPTLGIRESVIGSNGGGSHLYDWTDHMQGTNAQFTSSGGNIYCNGSLKLINTQAVNGEIRVKHDITVDGYNSAGFPGVSRVVCQNFTVTDDQNNHVKDFDVYCNHYEIQTGLDDGASGDVTAVESKHGITFHPLADSGLDESTIYPPSMLKEEIYGHAVGDNWSISSDTSAPNYSQNKIIKNIVELRNALNYDATTGEFDERIYINKLNSTLQAAIAADSDTSPVKWSRLKDSLGGPSDPADINSTSCPAVFNNHVLVFDGNVEKKVTVTIDTTETIVIVFEDGANIKKPIIINDLANREVDLFINGHITVGENDGCIIPYELYDRFVTQNTKELYEWDTVNLKIYAKKKDGNHDPIIEFRNGGVVAANAMAPTLSVQGGTTGGGVNGIRDLSYYQGASAPGSLFTYQNGGYRVEKFSPHWIGNAFIDGIHPNSNGDFSNNFTILYTRNGNNGGNPPPGGQNTVPMYYERYFAEY